MDTLWKDERWGSGWTWNDYDASYMAERSSFPIFGNVIEISKKSKGDQRETSMYSDRIFKTYPNYFDSVVNSAWEGQFPPGQHYSMKRQISTNKFELIPSSVAFNNTIIPFVTNNYLTSFEILNNILEKDVFRFRDVWPQKEKNEFGYDCPNSDFSIFHINKWNVIHSQPTDSLLKPMMHRSDNFFAEQTLLMVSNEMLGVMDDEKIIDSLLKTDFKDLPQKPRWVDGSGLSRYNLFTPQDFVAILNKMKNEFGMNRIKEIFPTGGEGTISSYYKTDSGFIYAKTGTLSGVVALSGFLTTKKNKQLLFSVLINNHQASATAVRRAVEKFIQSIRNKY
jgi:D-alanyl-D-alanine carboxypeptidase/D-alanyl-D-alanine-endopeptidase (penicillin-binding protein 4)